MLTGVTNGVKVCVQSQYLEDGSDPANSNFVFTYKITIENLNYFPVKLLKRHWLITESNGEFKEVEGEGVVGEQPKLEPGEKFIYTSACNLCTDIGTMQGVYTFENLTNQQRIKAIIPRFKMIAPFRLN